jgi:hypothetical protein
MTTTPNFPYQKSNLWLKAFSDRDNDRYAAERQRLRSSLDQLRERAGMLANEIAADLRELTVHDLSHSDALWDVAEVITGDNEELNPLEAFVLGAVFLIHDLGMGLAAYPLGMESLKDHTLWIGMLRNFFKKQTGRSPDQNELDQPPLDVLRRTQFEMLRVLHAERAEKLLETTWISPTDTVFHLLDDIELRLCLGFLIGRIASSHWWPPSELIKKIGLNQGAPVSLPGIWQINCLRIALILRTSDAAHIDARRAPAFLRILRRPDVSSDLHWAFQEKLSRVQIQADRLLYTGRPFTEHEAGAWWLCADTLKMIDSELRSADNILANRQERRFAAKGVVAVEDPKTLAQYIPVEGWSPVDARVHVSDIATLVTRLGGRELYGDNDSAPMRELLQNAADAIEARRILTKKADWGVIVIRTGKDEFGSWIELEDDGVGISSETLTGAFLDFGRSFWSSTEYVVEFPELAAVDFRSVGKFGIGFFSVFMWGNRVRVTSRRFDASKRDTHVLTFEKGLLERPIIRTAEPDEHLGDGGTRVRVWLEGIKDSTSSWMGLPRKLAYAAPSDRMSPQAFVKWLCPMIGINVFEEHGGLRRELVPKIDWLTIKSARFLDWSTYPRFPKRNLKALSHIRPMHDIVGKIIGRAAVNPENAVAWVMVGGMRTDITHDFVGAFIGEPRSASREESWVNVPEQELKRWADQQARLISKNYPPEDQVLCSRTIEEIGGSTKNLYICRALSGFLKTTDLIDWARNRTEALITNVYDFEKLKTNLGIINLRDDILFESFSSDTNLFYRIRQSMLGKEMTPELVAAYDKLGYDIVPISERSGRPILKAIATAWKCTVDELFIARPLDANVGSGSHYYALDSVELVRKHAPALDSVSIPTK